MAAAPWASKLGGVNLSWLFDDSVQPKWATALETRLTALMGAKMKAWDDALAALSAKADQLIALFGTQDASVKQALADAAAAKAAADAVIADDAASDAAVDQARADAIAAVAAKFDAVLNPPPPPAGGGADGGTPESPGDGTLEGGLP